MTPHARITRTGFWLACLCLCLTGCISSKELVLFQKTTADTLTVASRYTPTIQTGDVLSIQVSSLNPEATSFFNPYAVINQVSQTQASTPNASLPYIPGYLVDNAGNIEMPLMGKIKVAGSTTSQVADLIRGKVTTYLKEPTVNVRNTSFQVSVLGEVTRPSMYSIPNEQITLPQAIGLAGDLTVYGRRDNVLVIREENGQKIFARIDLRQRDLFKSPFYYLHPGDIVYVEPGNARVASADNAYRILPIILSALSIVAIIVTRL
ncbi:polysaccharide biosynthesis/export family protein [Arsenicibacter rosenii]|uniref:Sugar transporter n=1 Tax=Arsenicibacter rosenii TaxID=1750698 RepID=A0A1S2VKR1_9BACT|nr:polysaccharide biosynthesis/export family protein [Arsenicibacter rosenii]OIN58805.1 sugar transporter [Arsenicibacter rosenii]